MDLCHYQFDDNSNCIAFVRLDDPMIPIYKGNSLRFITSNPYPPEKIITIKKERIKGMLLLAL